MHSLRTISRVRVGGAFAAIAVLLALMMFIVLPAVASLPGQPVPPPSTNGVTPIDVNTGGQSNDCAVFGSPGANQYRIANPKSQTYSTSVNGTPVTFTLKLNPDDAKEKPAYANQKYVDFSSTGAAIADVGIKGGTDETDYRYWMESTGPVTADGALHAPAQATDSNTGLPTSLYSISNLTFCFDVAGSVSGTVYQDVNQNAKNDDGSPQAGWTVHLYQGTNLVKSTTSGSNGSYSFALQLAPGSQYTVCEAPPSGTWAQTQPSPSSANVCSASDELAKGYQFTPTSASQKITGDDFGNAGSTTCTPAPFGLPNYQIQFATCKPDQSYVFSSGTTPAGKPYVSVWAGDQTNATEVPLVEKITWPYDATKGQNQFTVLYTDDYPFDLTKVKTMQYCQLDPRDGSEFTLQAQYQSSSSKGSVLPGTETSCLISTTESADGTFRAYIYSTLDGLRTTE
jgi:SdrD B-like protein